MVVSRIVPSSEAEASRFACVGFHATAFTSSECTSSSFWSRRSVSQPSTFATSKILQIVKMLKISYFTENWNWYQSYSAKQYFSRYLIKVELKETWDFDSIWEFWVAKKIEIFSDFELTRNVGSVYTLDLAQNWWESQFPKTGSMIGAFQHDSRYQRAWIKQDSLYTLLTLLVRLKFQN